MHIAPETELKAITPPSMAPDDAVKIFFKLRQIQEASSYTIPEDADDDEEREAYRERAGRALARLRETHGSGWIRGSRPKDERALRSIIIIIISSRGRDARTARSYSDIYMLK